MGIDLSEEAVNMARIWTTQHKIPDPKRRIIVGDASTLPWDNEFFSYVLSHGVLDSVYFDIARSICKETARVMRARGLFYCDLISGDNSSHAREFAGEEIVETVHENGTVQSYFNYSKINTLIEGLFEILECKLIRTENIITGDYNSRYHLVLKKI